MISSPPLHNRWGVTRLTSLWVCLASIPASAFTIVSQSALCMRTTSTSTVTSTSTLTTASILKPTGSGLASSAKPEPEVSLDQFDFASQKGWDDFYQQLDASTSISTATPTTTTTTTTTTNIHTPPADVDSSSGVFEFDWHASIPHETILSEIKPLASSSVPCKVLFVGTGNSILPRRLYDEYRYSRDDDDGSDNDQVSIIVISAVSVFIVELPWKDADTAEMTMMEAITIKCPSHAWITHNLQLTSSGPCTRWIVQG